MEKLLFITDTFESLDAKKDTSILMMEEAIQRSYLVYQCQLEDLSIINNSVAANTNTISYNNDQLKKNEKKESFPLNDFKFSFIRKDPPVDEFYINALHLLGLAQSQGAKIYNDPLSIQSFNEKIFASYFSEFTPETLISASIDEINNFYNFRNKKPIIVKPLDGMGGKSIFKIESFDSKDIKILNHLTKDEKTQIVVQEFMSEVYEGDFRILVIHGKPFQKTLARIPQGNSFKGNLAAGGIGVARDITKKQFKIATEIGTYLMKHGINFAGIDIIGDKLTEINITSPTCAREILNQTQINPIHEYFKIL
tara:strand:+ start:565 stop:1494 length:930 start_codon:yes stop_codon:yes gene_type:complete